MANKFIQETLSPTPGMFIFMLHKGSQGSRRKRQGEYFDRYSKSSKNRKYDENYGSRVRDGMA